LNLYHHRLFFFQEFFNLTRLSDTHTSTRRKKGNKEFRTEKRMIDSRKKKKKRHTHTHVE